MRGKGNICNKQLVEAYETFPKTSMRGNLGREVYTGWRVGSVPVTHAQPTRQSIPKNRRSNRVHLAGRVNNNGCAHRILYLRQACLSPRSRHDYSFQYLCLKHHHSIAYKVLGSICNRAVTSIDIWSRSAQLNVVIFRGNFS